ncbi:hypothetical protein [Plantactinospora endophytica]|uniref:Uncharacterized protein n=1 Tax=Plantactinospora endophytica TaxID=673535 RepID=A0ABQ4EEA8_9ACTN|nr:hypothetical protein [Plantactinospora endophytica]GIG93067.1 hypothetical protein Pen02_80030 [Plantactinospora endophytica]
MRQTTRPARRGVTAVVVAAALVIIASGCNVNDSPQEREESNAIAAEIQETLAQRPEVEQVKVNYQNNLSASAQASVTITVTPGTDVEPVIEEATRLIWLSELHPLSIISIAANEAEAQQRGVDRDIDPNGTDKAELERRYGPRPPE